MAAWAAARANTLAELRGWTPFIGLQIEYSIMERFCLSVDNEDIADDLCDTIRGRGAFRRFKDRIQAYGIAEAWYRYRDAALREIAVAWCEEHGIPYTET